MDEHLSPTQISDDDWHRIQARIDSAQESGVAEGIEKARHPCPLTGFTEKQVERLIIKTTHHLPAGREFLLNVLEADGVHGFDAFIAQANEAMREDGKLDFEDLKPHHAEILKNIESLRKLKNPLRREVRESMTRRDFIALGISGLAAGAIAKNAVLGIDEAMRPEPREEHQDSNAMGQTVHTGATVAKAIAPTIEVGLAGVVLHDALKDRTDQKLDQINRAIVLFSREARKGVQGLSSHEEDPRESLAR